MSEKEQRIRSITRVYYSNPKVQKVLFEFSKDREVVPRYFEGFGKRPDALQYPSDIMGLVNKGATSFHSSEELWVDPLQINADLTSSELTDLRKSWDLLIDIDSPFLDYSKIAARLIIEELEKQGIKSYGIKFSGSKGFHIIVPASAFPRTCRGVETKDMFPEWPRAVCSYILYKIRSRYNQEVTQLDINFDALKERTNLSKEDITQTLCPNCGESATKGLIISYQCPVCKTTVERKIAKQVNRKLRCIEDTCPGVLEEIDRREHFNCKHCSTSSASMKYDSDKKVIYTREAKQAQHSESDEFKEEISGEKIASLDLVLVAPRHLFRMPYSLHEKTALASIVLSKEEIESFSPRDANPMKVSVKPFAPTPSEPEATRLLESAILWKESFDADQETKLKKKYANYENVTLSGVTEDMFPKPIKLLLKGLKDGRKRGLFILLTFLRSCNFSAEYINTKVREWNKKNEPELKEGYVKSQIEWHLRQKRQILPPNYANESFYKDLKLVDPAAMPKAKNPIVEVSRLVRRKQSDSS